MTATLTSITHSVLEGHRHLQRAVTALGELVGDAGRFAAKRGIFAARVVDLRHQLARHFTGEEQDGLFEQIQRFAPETADACARLRAQHATILAGLDRARDELPPASAGPAVIEKWVGSVRAVLAEVKAHEEHEDTMLLAALEGGSGVPD